MLFKRELCFILVFSFFQKNELTALNGGGSLSDLGSVLQVLDLQSNQLEKLPEEIGTLKELKVWNYNFYNFI